jgi:16S rRNA (guanine527-N7)-methyltransferase
MKSQLDHMNQELSINTEPCDSLADALRDFNPGVDAQFVPLLERYCRLLWEWNETHNLTRHTDFPTFVSRDLLDTLELAQEIPRGVRVLDVGSGGGVPGIPLAILRPDLKMALVESVAKKSAVLMDIIRKLGLNVHVYSDRAESVLKKQKFDVVTARAVAPLSKLLTWFDPCWRSIGELLLIKGRKWVDEQAEAEEAGLLRRVRISVIREWETPGRDGRSVILKLTRH